jgi:hypothetical protein
MTGTPAITRGMGGSTITPVGRTNACMRKDFTAGLNIGRTTAHFAIDTSTSTMTTPARGTTTTGGGAIEVGRRFGDGVGSSRTGTVAVAAGAHQPLTSCWQPRRAVCAPSLLDDEPDAGRYQSKQRDLQQRGTA